LVTKFGVKTIIQFSGVIIAAGLLTAVIFPYMITATIGFLLVGFGVSSVVPLVYGLAGKSSTMLPGVALAAVSSLGFLGFLVGPPLIGFIAQAAGLRLSFTVIAFIGLATTILASKVKIG
ncbi:MAG: MFS transporter, partial [Ferruginibacter sp.]